MPLSKTINNYETFLQELKLEKKDDKAYMDIFFKRKFIILENKHIIHPRIGDLTTKIEELRDKITKLKKLKKFWESQRDNAKNYYAKIKLTKYFKTKYWQHKLKQAINPEYKEDVISTKLTDEVLMDPEYKTLFETFLVDYDYRKKLSDTVNKSIIYRDNNIGDHNKKKQIFKTENAQNKIEKITEQINQYNTEIIANKIVIKYIKQINK
jgi:hypothetical protein